MCLNAILYLGAPDGSQFLEQLPFVHETVDLGADLGPGLVAAVYQVLAISTDLFTPGEPAVHLRF